MPPWRYFDHQVMHRSISLYLRHFRSVWKTTSFLPTRSNVKVIGACGVCSNRLLRRLCYCQHEHFRKPCVYKTSLGERRGKFHIWSTRISHCKKYDLKYQSFCGTVKSQSLIVGLRHFLKFIFINIIKGGHKMEIYLRKVGEVWLNH